MSKIVQDKSLVNLQRRQFLTGLSFVAAASAVSQYANADEFLSSDAFSSPKKTKGDEKSSATYHETQHIRDYYNSL
jgi:nitrous oxide reductase